MGATKEKTKEQEKPLAIPSPSPTEDVEASNPIKHHNTRWCYACSGCSVIIVVSILIIILILSLTLFKVKNPTLTMNSLTLDSIKLNFQGTSRPISLNATLVAIMSVKNPNIASFQLNNSTTDIYYEGETVGVAYAPAGNVAARRTAKLMVTVDAMADKIVPQVNFVIAGGQLVNLMSYTRLSGRVNLFGVYKKHFNLGMNCSMVLDVSVVNQSIKYTDCSAKVE